MPSIPHPVSQFSSLLYNKTLSSEQGSAPQLSPSDETWAPRRGLISISPPLAINTTLSNS